MTAIHRPLDRPFRRLIQAVSLAIGLGLAAVAPASAQNEGEMILLKAHEAAKELTSLSAKYTLSGESGFPGSTPKGEGTLKIAAQDDAVEGRKLHTRLEGTYHPTTNADAMEVTALRTPASFIYVEPSRKTVFEKALDDRNSSLLLAMDLMGLPELSAPSPFNRELRGADSWELVGTETVNGAECDVVKVVYTPVEKDDPKDRTIYAQESTWYFGKADRIPRRVERSMNEGISYTIRLDLADVKVNPGLTADQLAIATPEGFRRSTSSKLTGGGNTKTTREITDAQRAPAEDSAPRTLDPTQVKLPAHGFELVDADGNEVSLERLKGNVAVLYFWGTWCPNCKPMSPLVSGLADTFANDPVKVFGLPVRERSEDAVRSAMADYSHTLLLDPSDRAIGCDTTARAYKVRRYPTIYVVGAESEILSYRSHEADVDPADIVAEIEDTIREYLTTMN